MPTVYLPREVTNEYPVLARYSPEQLERIVAAANTLVTALCENDPDDFPPSVVDAGVELSEALGI